MSNKNSPFLFEYESESEVCILRNPTILKEFK